MPATLPFPVAIPKLILYCDSTKKKFTLRFEGAAISDSFTTMPAAIEYASTIVTMETALDVGGRELTKTTVLPAHA